MASKARIGGGVIGLAFLGLGVLKFLQGDSWVVWIILGVLFGGVAAFGSLLRGGANQ